MTWSHLGTALGLAVLAGGLSGLITAIIVNDTLDRYILGLQDDHTILQLTEAEREPLPGTYEEALNQLHDSIWSSMVFVFPVGDDWEWSDMQSMGVVMTSDGWLLFHEDAFLLGTAASRQYVINGESYLAEEVQVDPLTSAVMVRVEAQGLQTIGIAKTNDYLGGEMIFVPSEQWGFVPSVVTAAHQYRDDIALTASAETMTQMWNIADWDEMPVSIAFDPAGDLAALVGARGVHAAHEVVPFVGSILREGSSEHAALGALITDYTRIVQSDIQAPAIYSVILGGPADLAGLEAGDIILSIDGQRIDRRASVSELLAQYRAGDQIMIVIEREGDAQSVSVELGIFEDLLY